MRRRNRSLLAIILLPALTAACAHTNPATREPIPRAKVVENLSPIVAMEKRSAQLTMVMQHLPMVADISPEDARVMKEHYDVYFVYHNAAVTSLAQGNLEAYHDHVRVGSEELDSLEAKLKDVVEKSSIGERGKPSVPGTMPGVMN